MDALPQNDVSNQDAIRIHQPSNNVSNHDATRIGPAFKVSHLIWLLPIALLASIWLFNPFACPLVSKGVSLSDLNSAQRANIQLASRKIDGTVLRPGEVFSFNLKVGPRTGIRGFRPARTYIGEESPITAGGGICCLSSLLYQAALESGLIIEERVAHLRTIRTAPPGLDATVWYGSSDLRFRNDTSSPLLLSCRANRTQLIVQILGGRFADRSTNCSVRTLTTRRTQRELTVQVFRKQGGRELLVSKDLYKLSP